MIDINWDLVNNCGKFAAWGLFSLLLAEIFRDSYHALCHQVTWLGKWHNKHHMAYRRDLSLVSQKAYLDSQLYNDIVESSLLVVLLTTVALIAQEWGLWLGVLYAFTFLYGASLRYFQGTVETDYNHLPGH